MKILLDENLPSQFRTLLAPHNAAKVHYLGWQGLQNGQLLRKAEVDHDIFISMDAGLPYQQNLRGYALAVIILEAPDSRIETLQKLVPKL